MQTMLTDLGEERTFFLSSTSSICPHVCAVCVRCVCVSVSSHSLANVLVLNCCYQHLYKYALSQFQTQHALA